MENSLSDAEFERLTNEYLDAFNAGDYERVASFWSEDVIYIGPTGGEFRGLAALREFYRQTFESIHPVLSGYSAERICSGGIVAVNERWAVTINPPGAPAQTMKGRSVYLLRKEAGGVWRAYYALSRFEP